VRGNCNFARHLFEERLDGHIVESITGGILGEIRMTGKETSFGGLALAAIRANLYREDALESQSRRA
jgi:hypothetical protein